MAVVASAAAAMTRTASGHPGNIAGVVRITASEVVGAEVLPEILAAFAEHYPKIAFELHLSNRREDLLRRLTTLAQDPDAPTTVFSGGASFASTRCPSPMAFRCLAMTCWFKR